VRKDELEAAFDQQAAGYDEQWAKMAPIRDGLHFLLESVFAELPADSRILCVGAGTGAELAFLAQCNPHWSFTAVDPSGPMLDVCRQRVATDGFISRCDFHEGYLDSLPAGEDYDAATCFLVSQFILEQPARSKFFREIANRLKPAGILASSDLAAETGSHTYAALLHAWMIMMATADISPEEQEQMRQAYANDVAILSPSAVESIIESGGFEPPVQFFQAGLIRAWFSKRASIQAA
jgi:tRNA (cmo5U34)-methyltransferase